jgi:hypothetical protein
MNRRSFLAALAGGTAAAVAVRSFPFRSYFFPTPLPPLGIKPGDYILGADFGFEPGMEIIITDVFNVPRGVYRIVSHDRATRRLDLEPAPDITGRRATDLESPGPFLGLNRSPYPIAPRNQLARLVEFGDPGESNRARWRRKLLHA